MTIWTPMGTLRSHPPVKYFAGITYNPNFDGLDNSLSLLEETFSMIEIKSEPYEFSEFTAYYESEMGTDLKKFFVVFSDLQPPESLPDRPLSCHCLSHHQVKRPENF